LLVPKKSLGQNFLIDKNICKKIINLSNIKGKNIIEIGPGTGQLTQEIIKINPKKLILIEKDNNLINLLKTKYEHYKNIEFINEDALNYDYSKIPNAIIYSNLPYNVSTKIIFKLLLKFINIDEMIFMVQKEVAEKFDYNRTKKINKNNFFIFNSCFYKNLFNISNNVFYPKPKIQSSVITLKPKNLKGLDLNKLKIFTNKAFKNKRKKLKNNISFDFENEKIKRLLNQRVESLQNNEMMYLFNKF
jgi:16S rRNA (adenine1518-N6/adenine1519-N6)-dimethyltransferase